MADSENQLGPVANLVFGVVFIAGAIWMYIAFGNYEASGGRLTMPRIAFAIYKIVGKWGIVIPVGLVGVGSIWSGMKNLRGPC